MMCRDCSAMLLRYMQNPEAYPDCRRHLSQCASCREAYDDVRRQHRAFYQEGRFAKKGAAYQLKESIPEGFNRTNAQKTYLKWLKLSPILLLPLLVAALFLFYPQAYYWAADYTPLDYDPLERMQAEGIIVDASAEAETEEVIVRLTEVAADENQTHVYFEMESVNGEDIYEPFIYFSAVEVENSSELWPDHASGDGMMNIEGMETISQENGVHRGRIMYPPINGEKETVEMRFISAAKNVADHPEDRAVDEIPLDVSLEEEIIKQPVDVYTLPDAEISGEAGTITLEEMYVGPTSTRITYERSRAEARSDMPQNHMERFIPYEAEVKGTTFSLLETYQVLSRDDGKEAFYLESTMYHDNEPLSFQLGNYLLYHRGTHLEEEIAEEDTEGFYDVPYGRVHFYKDTNETGETLVVEVEEAERNRFGNFQFQLQDGTSSLPVQHDDQSAYFTTIDGEEIDQESIYSLSAMERVNMLNHLTRFTFELNPSRSDTLTLINSHYVELIEREEEMTIEAEPYTHN
ncbi:hypothetical protein [Alkalicoccus urumqiensis]|uniref:DUF4179 domain-containing protein n=1 Tax=Alkalicoccus urumqiensis TaxID=1548213 RepID=A0A2P6MF59_ALKUR|nr:hypothetical protein [Alkalicoccus urumqiensis]PRO64916.1 hypothetical protein C6I21_12290 [Alkalicoccus urumqiensis]